MRVPFLAFAAACALVVAGAAPAAIAQAGYASEAGQTHFQQDRRAILAQAGDYRVRFDMRETIAFQPGYEPLEPKRSGGHEIVRVIEDRGDFISLQHILVMEHGGQVHVVKHWRQDWTFEPETVLTYAGEGRWDLIPVSVEDRAGAWSQTVWQVDDAPRYGGVGRWAHHNGLQQWTSNETWRPLPRRDATRGPVYDRYAGTNRHVLTPTGWAHLQDNLKIGVSEGDGGALTVFVQEDVVNTYNHFDGFDPAPGDAYWAATADYWAGVRDLWAETIATGNGVSIPDRKSVV